MSDSKKIKVAIVINNIEGKENLLQQTMENLNGLTKNSDVDLKIIIAQCTDFVKDYNEIQRFICKNESEIYYRLPKNVDDVDYIAFINAI